MGRPRERRLAVAAACHGLACLVGLGAMHLGMKLSLGLLFEAGGLLLLVHLLTFERIPVVRILQERLARRHRCVRCGLQVDLVAAWQCGCRFVSAQRSALSPCPNCGKGFAWVACPGCGAGILI